MVKELSERIEKVPEQKKHILRVTSCCLFPIFFQGSRSKSRFYCSKRTGEPMGKLGVDTSAFCGSRLVDGRHSMAFGHPSFDFAWIHGKWLLWVLAGGSRMPAAWEQVPDCYTQAVGVSSGGHIVADRCHLRAAELMPQVTHEDERQAVPSGRTVSPQ
jgi:hypothetical protein